MELLMDPQNKTSRRNHEGTLPVNKGNVWSCEKSLAWTLCWSGSDVWVDPCIIIRSCLGDFMRANQVSECSDSSRNRLTDSTNLFHHVHFSFVDPSALAHTVRFCLAGSATLLLQLFYQPSFQNFYQNQKWIESLSKGQSQYANILMDVVYTKKPTTPEGHNTHCHQAHNWCRGHGSQELDCWVTNMRTVEIYQSLIWWQEPMT